jgi:hypothetical protein
MLRPTGFLHATYIYQNTGGPDLENVLFYNVGAGAFRMAATHHLRFERIDAPVPKPPLEFSARAYVNYQALDTKPHEPFPHGDIVAECEPVICEWNDLDDAGHVWKLFKPKIRSACKGITLSDAFKIQLTISASQSHGLRNLTSDRIMKRLLDGFISALHCRNKDDYDLDRLLTRLKTKYLWRDNETRDLLLDRQSAVLGPYRVPRLNGERLVWSPADHLLTGCEIEREFSKGAGLTIRGRLFRA